MRNEVEEAQVQEGVDLIFYSLSQNFYLYVTPRPFPLNFLDNLDETGGNNTANNVKWYKEPPFNYDESELISCKEEKIYDKKEKKLECYATVDDYKDLGPVLISDWLEKKN